MSFLSPPLSLLLSAEPLSQTPSIRAFPRDFPRSLLSRARRVIKLVHIYSGTATCLSPRTSAPVLAAVFRRKRGPPTRNRDPTDRPTERRPPLKVLRSHAGGVKNSILRDLLPRRAKQTLGRSVFLLKARPSQLRVDHKLASAVKKVRAERDFGSGKRYSTPFRNGILRHFATKGDAQERNNCSVIFFPLSSFNLTFGTLTSGSLTRGISEQPNRRPAVAILYRVDVAFRHNAKHVRKRVTTVDRVKKTRSRTLDRYCHRR